MNIYIPNFVYRRTNSCAQEMTLKNNRKTRLNPAVIPSMSEPECSVCNANAKP